MYLVKFDKNKLSKIQEKWDELFKKYSVREDYHGDFFRTFKICYFNDFTIFGKEKGQDYYFLLELDLKEIEGDIYTCATWKYKKNEIQHTWGMAKDIIKRNDGYRLTNTLSHALGDLNMYIRNNFNNR